MKDGGSLPSVHPLYGEGKTMKVNSRLLIPLRFLKFLRFLRNFKLFIIHILLSLLFVPRRFKFDDVTYIPMLCNMILEPSLNRLKSDIYERANTKKALFYMN